MLTPFDSQRIYQDALEHRAENEHVDACGGTVVQVGLRKSSTFVEQALAEANIPHPLFASVARAKEGASIHGSGKVLKEIRGMGKVYDWRASPWTQPNGGKIPVALFVQHIPVVPNVPGIADFIRLRDVLVAQGLMIQSATDSEGNAALYTPFDRLCYQARGANSFSCGTEHMHMSTSEPWTKKQLRASAWLVHLCHEKHGTPYRRAWLRSGSGVVKVSRRGQTTHMAISQKAGYNDRSDPGSGYDFAYVLHCVRFFEDHGHFAGA